MLKHKIVWVEEIKRFLKQNRNVEILHLIPHAWEEVSGQKYNVQYLIIYKPGSVGYSGRTLRNPSIEL